MAADDRHASNAPRASQPSFTCPPWCRGCGPNDPLHRSAPVTVGREGTGWLSLHLVVDRFLGRQPWLRLDATRYGATQTVVLSAAQAAQVIEELTSGVEAMCTTSGGQRGGSGRTDG
ncbi:hypothetical protein GCM10027290_32430 [Micromonospora sonneratiae]